MKSKFTFNTIRLALCGLCLSIACISSGCQTTVAGQVLPSPNYLTDDLQFFPPGPEFKLQEEANALEEYRAEKALGQN